MIHDLCDRLSFFLLENEGHDDDAIGHACETLAKIFRHIDQPQSPDSYAWDAAYERFGRWLMRGLPRNRDAISRLLDGLRNRSPRAKLAILKWSESFAMIGIALPTTSKSKISNNNGLQAEFLDQPF